MVPGYWHQALASLSLSAHSWPAHCLAHTHCHPGGWHHPMWGGWSVAITIVRADTSNWPWHPPQYSRLSMFMDYNLSKEMVYSYSNYDPPFNLCGHDYSAHCLMIVTLFPIPHQYHLVSLVCACAVIIWTTFINFYKPICFNMTEEVDKILHS